MVIDVLIDFFIYLDSKFNDDVNTRSECYDKVQVNQALVSERLRFSQI